jgi:hypothetical protein
VLDAALASRDATIDFSRGGQFTRALNRYVPFFNVAFQAPAQVARVLGSKDPGTRGRAAVGLMTMVIAPTIGLEVYNRGYGDLYEDVPQYDKDRGLIVMLPNQDATPSPETGRPIPRYLMLNMREWTPFVIATRESIGRAIGDNPRAASEALMAMAKSGSPIEPSQGLGGALLDVAPPILKTPIEAFTNYDSFRGQPIVPEHMKTLPPAEQYTATTTETAKTLGRLLGMSPAKIDHAVVGFTAGVGRAALAAGDMALRATGVAEQPSRRIERLTTELRKTGLSEEKRGQLEQELERQRTIEFNRAHRLRETPLIGGLIHGVYREQVP